MASTTLFAIGVFTVVLLAIFVYVSVRGVTHPAAEPAPFDELLQADPGEVTHPLRRNATDERAEVGEVVAQPLVMLHLGNQVRRGDVDEIAGGE